MQRSFYFRSDCRHKHTKRFRDRGSRCVKELFADVESSFALAGGRLKTKTFRRFHSRRNIRPIRREYFSSSSRKPKRFPVRRETNFFVFAPGNSHSTRTRDRVVFEIRATPTRSLRRKEKNLARARVTVAAVDRVGLYFVYGFPDSVRRRTTVPTVAREFPINFDKTAPPILGFRYKQKAIGRKTRGIDAFERLGTRPATACAVHTRCGN